MEIISSKKVLDNIYEIAKSKEILIRDVEEAAGVSTGYFSKLHKFGGDIKISVDMLIRVANLFDMSTDAVIHYQSKKDIFLTEDIKLFLNLLIQDTEAGKLFWKVTDRDLRTEELAKQIGFTDIGVEKLSGYSVILNNDNAVYLYRVRYFRKTPQAVEFCELGFEVYMADELHSYPVLMAVQDINDELFNRLEELHRTVMSNIDQIKVNDRVKDMIFNYLAGRQALK